MCEYKNDCYQEAEYEVGLDGEVFELCGECLSIAQSYDDDLSFDAIETEEEPKEPEDLKYQPPTEGPAPGTFTPH